MTPQECLVAYMEAKCELLPEGCRQLIFTDEDRAELLGWKDQDASMVLDQLRKNFLSSEPLFLDTRLCPWCLLNFDCMSCTFASRHGWCNGLPSNNDYLEALGLCAKALGLHHARNASFGKFVKPHPDRLRAILQRGVDELRCDHQGF